MTTDIKSYTLLELNTYIKRVLALNFDNELWVRAEILNAAEKRGHYYLTLIQKSSVSNDIVAQLEAVVWASDFQRIKKENPDLVNFFTSGFEIMSHGQPVFHERFGLQFRISDINTEYARGALDRRKEELFNRIRTEGLDKINKTLPLPPAILRLAVISSENAAGYIDFVQHIEQNKFGLKFRITLLDSVMQGTSLEETISKSLNFIEKRKSEFDAVAIIRGGGSKVDLAAFDNYRLAMLIAHFPLPVITGIGHEIDVSAMDLAASTSLKTPTAVAEFLINHNMAFLAEIDDRYRKILSDFSVSILVYKNAVEQATMLIRSASSLLTDRLRHTVQLTMGKITSGSTAIVRDFRHTMQIAYRSLQLSDPQNILKKGYTLVFQNKDKISLKSDFKDDSNTTIYWADGKVTGKFKIEENE